MSIAVVSMTYNDGYKLKEWREHFEQYKAEVSLFVIVDNGSKPEYYCELKKTFPEAVIIQRATNGGCTAAYNDGIRYVLENSDIDAITILANDIKLKENCLSELYRYLFSNEKMGIVSAPVLVKESDIVDNFGHTFHYFGIKNDFQGSKIDELNGIQKQTDLVSGGFYMAKRKFFEVSGLQDEKLFMYCDELDTMLKARRNGFLIGVTSYTYAWHHHINPDEIVQQRHPQTNFMISRNRIYIAKKYFGIGRTLTWFVYTGVLVPIWFCIWFLRTRRKIFLKYSKHAFLGACYGIAGKMEPNKYSFPIIN